MRPSARQHEKIRSVGLAKGAGKLAHGVLGVVISISRIASGSPPATGGSISANAQAPERGAVSGYPPVGAVGRRRESSKELCGHNSAGQKLCQWSGRGATGPEVPIFRTEMSRVKSALLGDRAQQLLPLGALDGDGVQLSPNVEPQNRPDRQFAETAIRVVEESVRHAVMVPSQLDRSRDCRPGRGIHDKG